MDYAVILQKRGQTGKERGPFIAEEGRYRKRNSGSRLGQKKNRKGGGRVCDRKGVGSPVPAGGRTRPRPRGGRGPPFSPVKKAGPQRGARREERGGGSIPVWGESGTAFSSGKKRGSKKEKLSLMEKISPPEEGNINEGRERKINAN